MTSQKSLVLVHKGSSFSKSYDALQAITQVFKTHFGDQYDVQLALTSKRAVQKLQKRGYDAISVESLLFDHPYESTTILPLMLFEGSEYQTLTDEHLKFYHGQKLTVLKPLIASPEDVGILARILHASLPTSPVLMIGHGSKLQVNDMYHAIETTYKAHYPHQAFWVRTLEDPLDAIVGSVTQSHVTLVPLMMTAGYHVTKDIFGEDSIEAKLEAAGIKVTAMAIGLLDIKAIQDFIIDKAKKHLEATNGI